MSDTVNDMAVDFPMEQERRDFKRYSQARQAELARIAAIRELFPGEQNRMRRIRAIASGLTFRSSSRSHWIAA